MKKSRFETWRDAFQNVVREQSVSAPLKAASLTQDLKTWTSCLTSGVVASCHHLGWLAAAKGHPLDMHPKPGKEYLNIDVMAFSGAPIAGRWRLPIAAFELENRRTDDRVGYSLLAWCVCGVQLKSNVELKLKLL